MFFVLRKIYINVLRKSRHIFTREDQKDTGPKIMKKRVNRTLFELISGILVFGLVVGIAEAVVVFFVTNSGKPISSNWNMNYILLGHLSGVLLAALYVIHMWWSIDRALDYDEGTATKKQTANYIIRYFALIIFLALACVTDRISPLTMFVGIMGIKFGAYLNKPMKYISNKIYGVETAYSHEEDVNEIL